MKRRLLIIAICLLLGAVANVAVAWGCAVLNRGLSAHYESGSRYLPIAGEQLSVRRWKRAGATLISVQRERRDLGSRGGRTPEQLYPAWADFRVSDQYTSGLTDVNRRWLDGRGWPRHSMWCELEVGARNRLKVTGIRGGIYVPIPPRMYIGVHPLLRGIALPLLPIWPGFAVNTLFYTTILWLLLLGPFALRRFLRLRRGLCPRCAYPMGESSVCTECGRALPSLA